MKRTRMGLIGLGLLAGALALASAETSNGATMRETESASLDSRGANLSRFVTDLVDQFRHPQEAPEMIFRRVLAEGDEAVNSHPSSDGQLLAFIDYATGDVAIHDLATGESRRVTQVGGLGGESGEFAYSFATLSPDGQRLFYGWCCTARGRDPGQSQTTAGDLRIVNIDGSGERVVFAESEVWPEPIAWTPDGEGVLSWLYDLGDDRGVAVAVVSTVDRSVRVLWSMRSGPVPEGIRYSPDGRYLAYERVAEPGVDEDNDLFIRTADGKGETRIAGGPGHERLMGWALDGSSLYFHSDRSGSPSVWSVPVRDGRATGAPLLIRSDVEELEPLGVGGGRFFYRVDLEQYGVRTMAIDVEGARMLAAPRIEEGPGDGETRGVDWSPDGRYIAYGHAARGRASIVIRSIGGGDLRLLPLPEACAGVDGIRWEPGGESLLVFGAGQGCGWFRLSLATGERTLLPGDPGRAALSPDGRFLYAANNGVIWRQELETARRDTLYRPGKTQLRIGGVTEISADGQMLAIGTAKGIVLMPATGGELRFIYEGTNWGEFQHRRGHPFTPDGKYVIVTRRPDTEDNPGVSLFTRDTLDELWAYPVDGGEPHLITTVPVDVNNQLRLHPDGRRLAFFGGNRRSELWVMEPAPKGEEGR